MGDLTERLYRVLVQGLEYWKVAEHEDDAVIRRQGATTLTSALRYLDDYAGRVISIIPADQHFSPADLKNPARREVVLLLTEEEFAGLSSRRYKIPPGLKAVVDVTFEDRYGATASNLLQAFPDATVTSSEDERIARDEVREANQWLETVYKAELAEWGEAYTQAFLAGEPFDPKPERPILAIPPEPVFDLEVTRQKRKLAQTIVHTGAGLYKVDSSGTTHNDTIDKLYRNILRYSEQYESWSPDHVTTDPDVAVDPEGGEKADKIIEDSALSVHRVVESTSEAFDGSSQYAFSVDAKAAERSRVTVTVSTGAFPGTPLVTFDLQNGIVENAQDVDSSGISSLGGGWYRCWFFATSTFSSIRNVSVMLEDGSSYQGDGVSGVYLWRSSVYKSTTLLYPPQSIGVDLFYYITLVTGGMVAGERAGELFVASGSYMVFANGTDWVGVRGDPSAESGSCSISAFTTIQSAVDQFYTDQGSANFTKIQYIRVFAGTYDEVLVFNTSINPNEVGGYLLVLEGDPADNRDNILLQPSSGTGPLYNIGFDYLLVRHMKIDAAACTVGITSTNSGCLGLNFDDCTLIGSSTGSYAINLYYGFILTNSTLTVSKSGILAPAITVRGCKITKSGAVANQGIISTDDRHVDVSSTTFSGFADGIRPPTTRRNPSSPCVRNCTFYNCTNGIQVFVSGMVHPIFVNLIFKDCATPLYVSCYPDEAGGTLGGRLVLRNICAHGYTNFVTNGVTPKTYAQLAAMDRVYVAGEILADPKLTDPDNGDFSLQVDSPCLAPAGHGSGVIKGYNDVPFNDPPDIGGWSSGAAPSPGDGGQLRYLLEEEAV